MPGASYATRLVHALQDSRTVFILMASFSAPPRKLPAEIASPNGPGIWDPDSEQPAVDHSYDDKKDEPGITETLKFDKIAARFDPPTNGTSIKFEVQRQHRRAFQPAYQKTMPTDIVPYKDAITEEEIWERFLERAKSKSVPLGSKVRAVQNYIKVGCWHESARAGRSHGRATRRLLKSLPLGREALRATRMAVPETRRT